MRSIRQNAEIFAGPQVSQTIWFVIKAKALRSYFTMRCRALADKHNTRVWYEDFVTHDIALLLCDMDVIEVDEMIKTICFILVW